MHDINASLDVFCTHTSAVCRYILPQIRNGSGSSYCIYVAYCGYFSQVVTAGKEVIRCDSGCTSKLDACLSDMYFEVSSFLLGIILEYSNE